MTSADRSKALRIADSETRSRAQRVFDRPLVVEAGAGTGKTSILVARIVVWALGAGWDRAEERIAATAPTGRVAEPAASLENVAAGVSSRIAAITFTEAAAAEMARRTGEMLAELEAGRIPIGVVEEALPPDATDRKTRARALIGALDHLLVRTIHAFCRGLLAQYPLEAGLHPGFQVDADERVQAEVVREVVESTVRTGYAEPGDPELIAMGVEGIDPARIEAALARLVAAGVAPDAFDENPFAPERIAGLVGDLDRCVTAFEAEEAGRLASATRSPNTLLTRDAVAATRALIDRDSIASIADLESFAAAARELWEGRALDRLKEWRKAKFNKSEQGALGEDTEAISRCSAELADLVAHICRLEPVALERARGCLGPLLREVRNEMRRRGAATYDALLRDTRELLAAHPDVRHRIRADLDQLLVDEFQDTDPLQCDIIRWIALEGAPEERPGLFLVGDPKQSIYGWRNADLRAFDRFVEEVLGEGVEPDRLSLNFRSLPAVLDAVERAIEPVMQREKGLQPAFQPLIPCDERVSAATASPAVEHWVSWDWNRDGGEPRTPTTARAAEIEAEAIARDLQERHARGGFAWNDAGILFRSTGDLETYLQALRSAGVPYAVERDRGYYRRREIVEASALVRCVLDPNDHLALLTWLRSASVGLPDAALLPLWTREFPRQVTELHGVDPAAIAHLDAVIDAAVAEVPDDVPGIDRIRGWEASLRQALTVIAVLRASFEEELADVFVEKLRTLSLVEATEAARYLGAYRVANLDRFFRDLRGELEESCDRETLLRRLRTGVGEGREAEEARPGGAEDAVRIMTIHKAKGLDFAHTYVVQLHKQSGRGNRGPEEAQVDAIDGRFEYRLFGAPTPGFHEVERQRSRVEAAERVRSLYVAMTRAKDRLVLLGVWPPEASDAEPAAARSHIDLLAYERSDLPDLTNQMIRLAEGGDVHAVDAADSHWVFPALRRGTPAGSTAVTEWAGVLSAADLRAQADDLRARRTAAMERSQRPWNTAPSADSHADQREEQANRRFGDERPVAATAGAASRTAAKVAGTAVHRILEDFDLEADPGEELIRQRRRLPDLIASLAGEGDHAAAFERAENALDTLAGGQLLARLCGLADHVVSRELAVLLPPPTGESGAVAFIAGSIDLCYRDPGTGEWVVADYKTDRVEGEAEVSALVANYTEQGRAYQRALQEALGLAAAPRFELWFLDADRVEVVA